MDLNELRQRRSKAIHDAREILDAAQSEKRDLTAEEQQRYDKFWDEQQSLKGQIEREEQLQAAENELRGSQNEPNRPDPENQPEQRTNNPRATEEYRHLFGRYLHRGMPGLAMDEYRALQTDDDEAGGYIVAPEQWVNELIKEVDDVVYIRQWARKFTVRKARSLGAPRRAAKMSTFAWSAEVEAPTPDTSLKFGKRNLYPHHLTGEILVSRDLMNSATMSPDQIVRMEMARDSGEVQEDAFLTGSGAEQPLGVFTASDDGISTSRDVSEGNDATAMTFDGLISAKYALKPQYWPRARWMFHRDGVKQVAKLKDNDGQYLWRESVRAGEPDRVLNLPVYMSERAPNTFTTGQYVGIVGDFSWYWIADALDMEIQRLMELKAETNQIAYIGRMKVDGMPVLEEAFARVKLG